MSVKTPVFKWDVPVLGESADVPADLLSLATEIENIVKALETKFLKTAGAGDAGKLLVVDATGVPTWRQATGDIENNNTGVFAIKPEKVLTAMLANLAVTAGKIANEAVESTKLKNLAVTTAKIAEEAIDNTKLANGSVGAVKLANLAVTTEKLAELSVSTAKLINLAVTEAKLADAAVTSRKWKPEAGVKEATALLGMTEALQDVVGCLLEITPATASILRVYAVLAKEGTALSEGRLNVDGGLQSGRIYVPAATGTMITSGFQVYDIPLTAAAHTIKLQARRVEAGTGNALTSSTRFAYELRSQ